MRREYRRTKVSAAESAELWERWKKRAKVFMRSARRWAEGILFPVTAFEADSGVLLKECFGSS
jgi:hypothetical protein